MPFLLPDLILIQSQKFEKYFLQYQANVKFIPNGVDCEKFQPVDKNGKERLRDKYKIENSELVILHVGHIKSNRQLEIFKKINKLEKVQVVIVGGTSQVSDEGLKNELISKGVIVIHEYLEKISEIYNVSDIYVFPIIDSGEELPTEYNQIGAIDLPLSVFEAMACNLPVVTTRFGALERIFSQGEGFNYIDNENELITYINNYSDDDICNTREKVLEYDWNKIVEEVVEEYKELV